MVIDFELHLKDPKELFVFDLREYDPFDENALGESGLEHMVARVIGFWFRAPRVSTRIYLPPEKIEPHIEPLLRRAVYLWCQDLLIANQRERVEFLINNSMFLGVALLILLFDWWVQGEIANPLRISDPAMINVINYAFDVLIWVALWAPVSAFLIDWIPLFRRYQAYKSLSDMKLTVVPETKTAVPLS